VAWGLRRGSAGDLVDQLARDRFSEALIAVIAVDFDDETAFAAGDGLSVVVAEPGGWMRVCL
jgi:hypothetical protein